MTLITWFALTGQALALAQTTPPVQPNTQEVPLPPAVTLSAPPKGEPAVPNRPLTADEAVQIALKFSPTVTTAQAGVTSAQGRVIQARAGLLPNLSASSTYTNQRTIKGPALSSGTGPSSLTGTVSSLVLRQLLLDFNHTREVVRQATAQERAAQHGLSATQQGVALATKQAFYAFTQNSHLVDVNQANVKSQQAQLTLAQARLDAGIGAPADVVQAKTNLASGETALNQAQSVALQSRVALAETLGVDPRTPIDAADSHEPAPPGTDSNALVDLALKQRPEMLQAQENVSAANHGVSAAKTTNAPVITADAALNARGSDDPFSSQTGAVGLTLSFPIFDAGLTAGNVRSARGALQAAQAQLKQTSLTVTQDVSLAYVQLKAAEQAVSIANSQVSNAQEGVRLAEGRYRAGVTTFIEVTTAQAALIAAQTSHVNSVSAVDQARAALAKAVGPPAR